MQYIYSPVCLFVNIKKSGLGENPVWDGPAWEKYSSGTDTGKVVLSENADPGKIQYWD